MGPPTVTQRVDQLEEKATAIEETMADMVATAVARAFDAMKHSLTELVLESQAVTSKKMGGEFEVLAERLEGRISRSREY